MNRVIFVILISLSTGLCFGQYKWKLEKDQNGIKVYSSEIPRSEFKAIKVECSLIGNYSKLVSILSNISQFNKWVFHSKDSKLLKQNNPLDFIYHTETEMPWPLSNRDAVIHLRIRTDSLPKFLAISGTSEPGLVPKVRGKVRVDHYKANWLVTMPKAGTIHIIYEVEVDPGGSIPGWIANMFVAKGPYETFSNLGKKLKE